MYSAKEAAALTGLTTAALRYYEREQLLPPVGRNRQNYRQYSDTDIQWIQMIQCLRQAGVPIQSIRGYVGLLMQGGRTLPQRRQMVQGYLEDLTQQMEDLQAAMELVRQKLAFYEALSQVPSAETLRWLEEWDLFQHKGDDGEWTPF